MKLTKIGENYLNTAALLREEIAELRSRQKNNPQQSAAYEKRISLLFEAYSRLLDDSAIFQDEAPQEEIH